MDIVTYLSFDGRCEEAFRLYAEALGGHILTTLRYRDAPDGHGGDDAWGNLVMHTRMQVGDRVLMGSDAPPPYHQPPEGKAVSVTVNVDTAEEAERIFAALSEGASIEMAMGETFWATRFGMLRDRFGIPWMVNCEKPTAAPAAGADTQGAKSQRTRARPAANRRKA